MGNIITFCNQKGGVAKSTTAEAFASILTSTGERVLMVDMDEQPGNMSLHVGADKSLPGTFELLDWRGRAPSAGHVTGCIQDVTPFGAIIAADIDLGDKDAGLLARMSPNTVLQKCLATVRDEWDWVIVDTPPALGVRTRNAILAADYVIVPCKADVSSVGGMQSLLTAVEEAQPDATHPISVAGVVVTDFNPQTLLEREMDGVIHTMAEGFGVPVFGCHVRHTVRAKEAQRHAEPLVTYAAGSTAAEDYKGLVREFLDAIGDRTINV